MAANSVITIDMRSDTVTKPCRGMREALASAEVGDDVFGDDPTVIRLQNMIADIAGMEAALFVPSGTMGNFISIMAHCWGRGCEILVGDKSHTFVYEQGNVAQFGGVHPRLVSNLPDGTFSVDEMKSKVRQDDAHFPVTTLVSIENTHNACGGKALPIDWIRKVTAACRDLELPVHCDGARIFNAATASGLPVKELLVGCSSVSICMSKGLGAPCGSVIAGSKEFIRRATRLRKAVGGGMRQAGVLAAAAIFALENNVVKLAEDHRKVRELAQVFTIYGAELAHPEDVESSTNLLFVSLPRKGLDANMILKRLEEVTDDEFKTLGFKASIKGVAFSDSRIRLVPHVNIGPDLLEMAKKKIKFVLEEQGVNQGLKSQ